MVFTASIFMKTTAQYFLWSQSVPIFTQISDSIIRRYSLPNSIPFSRELWKVLDKIYLRPQVKYDCHGADFHETHLC